MKPTEELGFNLLSSGATLKLLSRDVTWSAQCLRKMNLAGVF